MLRGCKAEDTEGGGQAGAGAQAGAGCVRAGAVGYSGRKENGRFRRCALPHFNKPPRARTCRRRTPSFVTTNSVLAGERVQRVQMSAHRVGARNRGSKRGPTRIEALDDAVEKEIESILLGSDKVGANLMFLCWNPGHHQTVY